MPTMEAGQLETWVDAQCALLGLTLAHEHRPGVLRYAQLVMGMADKVMDFPLAPHDESGSVFVPVAPAAPMAPTDAGVGT